MAHTHAWRVTHYLLLELPVNNYADRLMQWDCPCGAYALITGHIQMGTPLHSPAWWAKLEGVEQRGRATAASRHARQEQQRKIW
jgi:hypothetical protein